jgi:hypothetical protein
MPASKPPADPARPSLVDLKLQIPEELHRAFQRCLWIRIHETGLTPLQIMEEVVHDFLKKHGC